MSIRQEAKTTTPEGALSVPKINFYGNYKEVLDNNLKPITFRKPKEIYNFSPGTLVHALSTATGEIVPLRVIGVDVRPFGNFSDIHLMLDGFPDHGTAIETLSEFPGYSDVGYKTPMMAIYTITDALFQSLSPELQESMLAMGFDSLDDVDQPDAAITWPALCFWLLYHLPEDEEDNAWQVWIDYLIMQDLVGRSDGNDRLNSGERKSKNELLEIAMGSKDRPEFKKYILLEL